MNSEEVYEAPWKLITEIIKRSEAATWKEAKKDKSDALMRSFDTMIESKAYIEGFVDAIVSFTKDADEDKLLKEFKVEEMK